MVTSRIMNSERGKGLSEDTSILNLRQNALMGSEVAFIFKINVSGCANLILMLAEQNLKAGNSICLNFTTKGCKIQFLTYSVLFS